MEVIPDNTLIIKFDGIELPDSGSDYNGSQGNIIFSILPKAGLPDGTVINNQAGIYFDANEVVLTNNTINTLYDKPSPEALFSVQHNCTSTNLSYNFNYTGGTPDNATYLYEFEDAVPSSSIEKNPTNITFNSVGNKIVRLTVTRNGCTETYSESVAVSSIFTTDGNKVRICHNGQQIEISRAALNAHLSHGDCVGACSDNSSTLRKAQDQDDRPEIILNPNPSTDECIVSVKGNDKSFATIAIYNYTGLLVSQLYSGPLTANPVNLKVDTKELIAGIYFVKTFYNNETIISKLIIQH
jgi:hypothetical protein